MMTINGHEILQYWVTSPDVQLYKREDSTVVHWCEESQRLITWGAEELVPWVAEDPRPETIEKGKSLLEDRYWLLYHRAELEHRRDEGHADHPCLHRAW